MPNYFQFNIKEKLLNELKTLAKEHGMALAPFIRFVLIEKLKREKAEQPLSAVEIASKGNANA